MLRVNIWSLLRINKRPYVNLNRDHMLSLNKESLVMGLTWKCLVKPGAAQEAPRRPQEPPEAPQEHPKSRPRGQIKEQKRLPFAFPVLGGLREASGSHFEAIWERFGGLRGGILEPFLVAFSSLFLSPSRGCGLLAFRCSWLRLPPCSGRKARREAAGTHAKRVTSLARPL